MNCPYCGAEAVHGLKYCKRCGNNLSPSNNLAGSEASLDKLTGMFWVVGVFSMVSLLALFGSVIPLTIFGAGRDIIIPVVIFGSGAIFGIAGLLVRQLSRLIDMSQFPERPPRPEAPNNAEQYNYPQLHAQPRPISSVTEHTTRNFDPAVYKEPAARE